MPYLKRDILSNTGWISFVIAWFCLSGLVFAASQEVSSCVTCHTHYGNLKKSLSKTGVEVSPLIEGMG